jgi:hypothetical protein
MVVRAGGSRFAILPLNSRRCRRETGDLSELREGFPIALVSLGSVRRMTIRAKAAPRRVIQVELDAGSLLMMDYATQLHYTHAVAKTTQPVWERISLAFRVKRDRIAAGHDQ